MKRTMRRNIVFFLVLLVVAFPVSALSVVHNAEPIVFDVPPQNVEGRVLVPLRAIFEELGAEVTWDDPTQTVTATKGGKTVQLTVGNTTALIDGKKITLDAPARLVNDRTLVPARFISESLGASVNWDNTTETVRICDKLYPVLRAVDGDTLEIDYNGVHEKVRLIGVDTPESVHPDEERNTEEGKTAAEHTAALVNGKSVELEFDVEPRDQYGRLLAYVYIDGVMLNKTLLREGYAALSTYPPNVKHVEEFREIAHSSPAAKPLSREEIITDLKAHPTEEALKSGIVITETGSKYHRPACRTVTEGIPITLEQAEALGYTPCGICMK